MKNFAFLESATSLAVIVPATRLNPYTLRFGQRIHTADGRITIKSLRNVRRPRSQLVARVESITAATRARKWRLQVAHAKRRGA